MALPANNLNAAYVNYIHDHKDMAIQHMNQYKIPASIKLAQALLESAAGTSYLARTANNHFGIKCNADWRSPCITCADDTPYDNFRVYKNVKESYEDHSRFLQRDRYKMLFNLGIRDYVGWANGLQLCGYATDTNYSNKLISLIRQYELYNYDVLEGSRSPNKTPVYIPVQRSAYIDHGLLYVLAEEDDSYAQIAVDLGFNAKKLAEYNDGSDNFPLRKGDIVYLEKKLKKAKIPYFNHIVQAGESMHSISQMYGMQVKSLYKLNYKSYNYVLREGDILRLR